MGNDGFQKKVLCFALWVFLPNCVGCFSARGVEAGAVDATLEDASEAVSEIDNSMVDNQFDGSGVDSDVDDPVETCRDLDHDGHPAQECGGDDCDDSNPIAFPGAAEVCDTRGVDEDCDPCTVAGMNFSPGDDGGTARREGDDDRDGYISLGCFNRYEGPTPTGCSSFVQIDGAMRRVSGRDCDDTNDNTHPEQTEVCNGHDDNCNGETDEGVQHTYYIDRDGDGFGDRASSELARMACARPVGFSETADDCDDMAASVSPAAREVCDMAMPPVDENCNGTRNEGCDCPDGADRACMQPGICAAGRQRCVVGRWGNCSIGPSAEMCNGIDDNCDGMADNVPPGSCRPTGAECRDGRCQCPAGQDECGGVCRAVGGACNNGQSGMCARAGTIVCDGSGTRCTASPVSPSTEICNGVDDDCDGQTDELNGSDCPRRTCSVCSFAGVYQTCSRCSYSSCRVDSFARTYAGSDPSFQHQCGSASGDSWSGSPLGCDLIQYGPFVALPSGSYRVEYQVHAACSGPLCPEASFDVTFDSGREVAASAPLRTISGSVTVSLSFTVSSDCRQAELRVHLPNWPVVRMYPNLFVDRTVLYRN